MSGFSLTDQRKNFFLIYCFWCILIVIIIYCQSWLLLAHHCQLDWSKGDGTPQNGGLLHIYKICRKKLLFLKIYYQHCEGHFIVTFSSIWTFSSVCFSRPRTFLGVRSSAFALRGTGISLRGRVWPTPALCWVRSRMSAICRRCLLGSWWFLGRRHWVCSAARWWLFGRATGLSFSWISSYLSELSIRCTRPKGTWSRL